MKDNFLGKKMRDLRSVNKVNEDNASGFHSNVVTTGFDRAVTGGNDSPLPVTMPKFKESIKKSKDILLGKKSNGDDMNVHDDHSIISIDDHSVHIDKSVHHSSLGDGLAWFGTHWKEIAIVAGAAALILAISKLIKGLNKSIKIRYNRVVKTLQRAQKDFTLAEDGLNMKSVMPGIGSGIYDWISRMWTGNWKSKKHTTGNIGLHPFCSQYIEEIEMDFRTAQDAFSKIKLGADESNADDDRNTDTSVGESQNNVSTSAYSGKVYSSFHEAYSEEFLNEGVSPDKVDESVLAMISAGVALTSLAVRAGQFLYQRYKNGKPVGEQKQIQVTKESTREICYAIINNYADKYVNMQQVFREIGINSQSLADIDTSACDKLTEILKKYQKPEKNSYTKQYERIEKAYRKMLKHYYAIGDGIISNFVKYSEAKDEKHSNLIVASREKLQNMWDSQKDFYDNNFSHVLIEIISSEAYINYLDFIIEKVIPVFKSGLASDADYVLDIVPKKGEYYLLRQTGNGQAVLGNKEVEKGNVAIAEVINFDRESKKMKFKLIGLVKGKVGDNYTIGDDGVATLSTDYIDYNAYKEHDEFNEDYSKWLALDPVLLDWTPEQNSDVYKRVVGEGKEKVTQFLYAKSGKEDKGKGYNTVYLVTTKGDSYEIVDAKLFKIDNYLQYRDFDNFVKTKSDNPEENMGFEEAYSDRIKKYFANYEGEKPVEPENVHTTEELVKKINEKKEFDQNEDVNVNAESPLYARISHTKRGREIYEYMFAMIEADEESLGIPMKNRLNEEGEGDSSTGEGTPVIEPGTDDAKKDLVKTVFICNIDVSSGKTIADPANENKFDGSSIEIDPACSIDEVNKKAEELEFTKVDKNASKIKQIILGNILKQTGSVQKASSGKFAIDQLDKAIEEMENREGSSDRLINDAGEIAQKILDEYNKLGVGDDWFEVTPFNKPSGSGFVKGFGRPYLVKKDKMQKPYVTFDTGIKRDGKDDNIMFYLYPTLIKEGNDPKAGTNLRRGIIIYYNENIFQIVPADSKDEIEKAIKNINDALVNGGHIEPSRFAVVQGEGGEGSGDKEIEDKVKADIESLFKIATPAEDASTKAPVFDVKAQKEGNVEITAPTNAGPSTKVNAHLNGCDIVITIDINNGNVKVTAKYKGKDIPALDIPAKSFNADVLVKGLVQSIEKAPKQESVNVTYSFDSTVNESIYTSTVTVNRKFDKRMRNWFVLSEAIYDDGSNKVSKLDNPRFRKALLERSDCAGFAKTSKLAKFMPYDMKQNYTLVSEHNYTPSVATPLYESVMLVKFDKMDRITEKNYLGKHKIG